MNDKLFTVTSATVSTGPTLTPERLAETVRAIKAAIQENPEPIGEWMRGQGFPPETCCLILPERMRELLGPFWPPYVSFSSNFAEPTLCRFNPQQLLRVDPPAS